MNPYLEAALAAEAVGLSPLPPKQDGSKAPISDWVEFSRPDSETGVIRRLSVDEVRGFYRNGRTGVGIVTGQYCGQVELLEFDDKLTYEQFLIDAESCGLAALVTRIRLGYEEATPGGGIHWLMRCDEVIGNTKLAQRPKQPEEQRDPRDRFKTLIETRGTGGYAITAPSNGTVHPTGGAYRLLSGGFATIAQISSEEHKALWELARSFNQMPISEPRRQGPHSVASGERPGDTFNQRTIWADVLAPAGWKLIYDRVGKGAWRRPGKAFGISATTNATGNDTLIVFSSSTPFDVAPASYNRFGAYTLLEHGGDFAAAARELSKKGYGLPSGAKPKQPFSPTGPDGEARRFPRTDSGNAELFAYLYGDQVRYDHMRERWLRWETHWWREDHVEAVIQMAKEAARYRYQAAESIADLEERQLEAKWAISSENRGRLESALTIARSETPIADAGDEWDTNPWLLGVANGVVNLRTGTCRDGRQGDKITKHSPTVFDPEATAPLFEKFLTRTQPDDGMRRYLQRRSGYAATGDVGEQDLAFHHGGGSNGKTTLANALMDTLGLDYSRQAAPGLLLRHSGDRHPTEIADLDGARLIVSTEVDDGRTLAEELVKQVTGGDRLKARRMRQDFYEFEPTFKIFLLANHRPVIRGTDYAIWRRIKLIPWDVQIPKPERDSQLRQKLKAETSGILNWIVAGCLDWQRHGMQEPQAVTDATEEYRSESDPLASFLSECCISGERYTASASALYKNYTAWATEQGLSDREKMTATAFGRAMGERFERKRAPGKGSVAYQGVGLTNEYQTGFVDDGVKGSTSDNPSQTGYRHEVNVSRGEPENYSQPFTPFTEDVCQVCGGPTAPTRPVCLNCLADEAAARQ